jgi:hypothetical protein
MTADERASLSSVSTRRAGVSSTRSEEQLSDSDDSLVQDGEGLDEYDNTFFYHEGDDLDPDENARDEWKDMATEGSSDQRYR